MRKRDKRMSAHDAVAEYVRDGDTLIIGNYTVSVAFGLVSEVVRQRKKGLTLCSQSGHLTDELLVAGGCVERLVTAFVMSAGTVDGVYPVARALKAGTLQIEDYTNFQYNARLVAGMHGYSYMPVLEGVLHTDLFDKRGFMGEGKYGVMICPFTGRDTVVVPALNPDVCVVHVQRADKCGNAQYWGAMGSVQAAALASSRVIVSCEEIVEQDVIESSPHFTIIPAFRVDAVVEMPWGAHPGEVLGYYNVDKLGQTLTGAALLKDNTAKDFLDEWIYGRRDHNDYIKHYIQLYGMKVLDAIKARAFYSAPANYGSAFSSAWDSRNLERTLRVTFEEMEQFMKDKGVFYE